MIKNLLALKSGVTRATAKQIVRAHRAHRISSPSTGLYPFLIGDAEELERIEESGGFNKKDPTTIVRASFEVTPEDWIAHRRKEMQEYDIDPDGWVGEWPGEILDKGSMLGSMMLHTDIVTRKTKPEIYLGFARIEQPWHLPAAIKYGDWNECPGPEVHCAFHREWQERYGAEITGMSGDVVECTVSRPPTDREAATILAWQQYWYCADIVEQGVETVSNLAATLLNSPYWYFWWD